MIGILVLCVVAGIIGWQLHGLIQERAEYRQEDDHA